MVAYDTGGKVLSFEIVPKTVDATLTITSPSKEVPIKIVPKGDISVGKSIKSIVPSSTSVIVYGEEEAVNKVNSIEILIDVDDLTDDKTYNITLTKPNGITELSVKTITVKVEVDSSVSKEFKDIPITTENLNSKYKVQAMSEADSKVDVVVKGSSDIVNNIDSSSIKAFIDLKDYAVGEHEVEVQVKGSDVKLSYTSKTKKVRIKITEK